MIALTAYRGPDGQRFLERPEKGPRAVLGHARLSIVDLKQGWQPLRDESGATWVVANGEIYNRRELRAELVGRGHRFATGSDTEAALHLVEEALDGAANTPAPDLGPDPSRDQERGVAGLEALAQRVARAVARLDGMYALAVWHEVAPGTGYLVLARDPVGIRPLYWGWGRSGGGAARGASGSAPGGGRSVVYFASEIKAIRTACQGYEPFPPGSVAVFRVDAGRAVRGPAWARTRLFPWERGAAQADASGAQASGPQVSGEQFSDEAAVEQLEALLRRAVVKRLMADVPLGVLLSGGLDSSLVAALARQHYEGPLHSFAVGTPDSPDLDASARVAAALGTVHHVRTFTEADARRLLPTVIYHLESFDAPLVRSALANYLVFEMASEHVRVALSGEGSDELFAGYESLAGLEGPALGAELARLVELLHNTNLQRSDRMGLAFGVEARVPFLDMELLDWAFSLPAHLKRRTEGDRMVDKWVVRALARRFLPENIAARPKAKFSQGSGAAATLALLAEELLSDGEWHRLQARCPDVPLNSREQALYLRLFLDFYPEPAARRAIGLTRSVVPGEVA